MKPAKASILIRDEILLSKNRFMSFVDLSNGLDGCWNWKGHIDKAGYGRFGIRGINKTAHRISFVIFVCAPSTEMLICHHCDNRACVRPDHLFEGTYSDNCYDMHWKDRHKAVYVKGQNHHSSKLSDAAVADIKSTQYFRGIVTILSKKYGVHQAHISNIRHGKRKT